MFNFYRAAAVVPDMKIADPEYNAGKIIERLGDLKDLGVGIAAFPELAVTGYTCQDLFYQKVLLDRSGKALSDIITATEGLMCLIAVGAPVLIGGRLYNGAFIILNGRLLGINIKTMLPQYGEFYEKRWFSSAAELSSFEVSLSEIGISGRDYIVPVGNDIIYDIGGKIKIGCEICEDAWSSVKPSAFQCLKGAEVILNLSASNETIAKREYRKGLIKQISADNICEYIYASSGSMESTSDLIFSGHSIIAENGTVLNENKDFIANDYILVADIDPDKIRHDRMQNNTFADSCDCWRAETEMIRTVHTSDLIDECDGRYISVKQSPFIPNSKSKREIRCREIFDMQVGGLMRRLSVTGAKPCVGVSGGLDSTLALLVSAMALKRMNRSPKDLLAITMPAYGTTDRTRSNAEKLIEALGADPVTIDIKNACDIHLKDIGLDPDDRSVAYENAQARERMQILMDYANKENGLVVGTGDLSELALGWCTYNGDHMSMYGVNASIPKTLVRWMVQTCADLSIFPGTEDILRDIADTPISPELLPPDKDGNMTQKTEDKIGPYELHDFFIYNTVRYGFEPSKVLFLAGKAFKDIYSEEEIKKWFEVFIKRFFSQQFKRNCMPDGVKVGSVSFSPRGDLRMPADAYGSIWLKDI